MEALETEVDESDTIKALAALAQVQRLRAFRSLIAAGPEGLTPGAMAEQLGIAPSGLSFHLKELSHAGLVSAQARGRNLIYRANFDRMNGLLAYLTEHCCQGEACEVTPAAGCSNC